MQIQNFDKDTCKALRVKLTAVLLDAGIEGVDFHVGSMSFTDTECKIRVTAKTAGAADARLEHAGRMAKLHGLACTERDGATLVDYEPKKHKYPFIIERKGKRFKLTPDQAIRTFGAA